MSASDATIAIVEEDDGTMRVSGDLDAFSVPTLTSMLEDRVRSDDRNVVLDMAGVTFVDSSGLQALVEFHQRFSEHGGALVINAPSAPLVRLLDVTGLDKHFNVAS